MTRRESWRWRGKRFVLTGVLLCANPLWAEVAVPRPTAEFLTLKDCLDRAFRSNPRLLAAQKEVSIADAQVRQARSLFPRIGLDLSYVRYRNETLGLAALNNSQYAVLEAPIQTSEGNRGNPLAENLYLGRVGFLQTLYAGGKQKYTYMLAVAGKRHTESDYQALRDDIAFETTRAYLRLLAIAEKKRLVRETLVELGRRFSTAAVPVARAQAEVRAKLSELDLEHRAARYDFLEALGAEMFSELDAKGTFDQPPVTVDLQTALVWAKQNRAELRGTEITERANQLSVDLSNSEKYPVLTLGGGYEMRNSDFPLEDQNWNAALNLSVPVFDGFSSRAQVKESRSRAEQGRLQRVELEDKIDREVRTAFDALSHWDDEKSIRRTELAQLDSNRHGYLGNAPASVSDRVQFLQWLLEANVSVVEAEYQGALARAQLERAVGRSLSTH